MFDFFVSHASKDKITIVDELVSTLSNMGYSVWYDKNEILAGDNIISEVKKGLSNSYCLLLVLTENFVNSKWTYYETGFFDKIQEKRIVPLLYNVSDENKTNLFGMIGNRKYLDINSLTKEELASELAKTVSQAKHENNDLHTIEKLKNIQKQLATHETVNAEIISIKLKEYLDFHENHKEFLLLSAKQIVKVVSEDLLKSKGYNTNEPNSIKVIEMLKRYNIGSINFREYVDFVLTQNSEAYNFDYISVINHSLLNILTYYIHTRYPTSLSFSQIEVVFPDELTYKDFEEMYEIDKKVMREDLIADVKTTYDWFKYNRYTHIAVKDVMTQKTIGYFSVLPVTNEVYDKIVCGDFMDKDFTSDSIEQYIFSKFYRVYIAGVGIDPEYQNTGAFIKLYNALIDLMVSLAKEREIYISEVLAEASTKQGEKFCKMVGMKRISSTNNGTDIYKLVTIPPEFRLGNTKGKELHILYQKKFEEFKDYFDNE